MRKNIWAWIAGGAVFAAVAGFWLWQLPGIIRSANGGQDTGLANIFNSVKDTKESLAPDFVKLQDQVGKNLEDLGRVAAVAAQAQALDDMKKQIEAGAVKKKIEAALIKNPSTPLPSAPLGAGGAGQ
jgi:hypothetical protein